MIYTTNTDGSHYDRVVHPSLEYLNSRRAAYRLTPLTSLANHSSELPGDDVRVVLLPPETPPLSQIEVPLSMALPLLQPGVNELSGWDGMEPDDYPSGFLQIGFEELERPCFLEIPDDSSSTELVASPGSAVGGQLLCEAGGEVCGVTSGVCR